MALIKLILYIGLISHLFGQGHCTISCQFDAGLCGWRVLGKSLFSWRSNSGQTMDRTSGPLNDVTCKNYNGQYAYIPGIYSKKGEKAALESEEITVHTHTVFSFWYFMNGVGIGSMEVLQMFTNHTQTQIWSRKGEQEKGWQRGSVKIEPGTFAMRFQGSVELPYGSDMAIDDVVLESENAVFNTSHCGIRTTKQSTTATHPTTTIQPTTTRQPTTTTKKPVTTGPHPTIPLNDMTACKADISGSSALTKLPGSCDFETGTCDLQIYASEADNKTTWKVSDKQEQAYYRAPIPWDHTYNHSLTKGHYLLFKNSKSIFSKIDPVGELTSVQTPVLSQFAICLSFWYIMPTTDANLLVSIEDTDGNVMDIWKSENVTKSWSNAIVSVANPQPFKIIFQTRNKKNNGKVALDDIVIIQGNDVTTKTTQTTTTASVKSTPSPTKVSSPSILTEPSHSTATFTQPSHSTVTSTEQNKLTKKPTEPTTKKPNIKLSSNKDKQTGHKYRNSSTVVGYSVGGLVLVTLIGIAVYLARQSRRNKRLKQEHHKPANQTGHVNGGLTDRTTHIDVEGMTVIDSTATTNGGKMNGSVPAHAGKGRERMTHVNVESNGVPVLTNDVICESAVITKF